MTLSSRHRIRNSSPGGLRPSTLPFGHGGSPQYWLLHVDGGETFLFLSNRRDREPNPELWRERHVPLTVTGVPLAQESTSWPFSFLSRMSASQIPCILGRVKQNTETVDISCKQLLVVRITLRGSSALFNERSMSYIPFIMAEGAVYECFSIVLSFSFRPLWDSIVWSKHWQA